MADPNSTPAGVPPAERRDIYQIIGRLQLFEQLLSTVKTFLPSFTHSIEVAVVGGPSADIRRIWYLCVSAAMGRFRNKVRTIGAPISMAALWDITGKTVSFEIAYQLNSLSNLTGDYIADPGSSPYARMLRGPEQLTVGADWGSAFAPLTLRVGFGGRPFVNSQSPPNWVANLSGFAQTPLVGLRSVVLYPLNASPQAAPSGAFISQPAVDPMREIPRADRVTADLLLASAYPYSRHLSIWPGGRPGPARFQVRTVVPTGTTIGGSTPLQNSRDPLPDSGRIITTVEKRDPRIQPPKPPVDGHTRCSVVALVAQSLLAPCFLPETPPPTANPAGSSGRFALPLGAASGTEPADLYALWSAAPNVITKYPLPDGIGPDGYPVFQEPNFQTVVNYAN